MAKSIERKKNTGKKRAKRLIVWGLIFAILGAGLIGVSALFRFDEWRAFDSTLITECNRSLTLTDRNGEAVLVTGPEKRIPVPLSSLQKHTIDAFICTEDLRFYSHGGMDVKRIFGALLADIKAGGYVQGASTISQQLIKLSHLSSEKTLNRKLEEAMLTLELEHAFTKDEILEAYLNYIYFGGGFYGIEAAALGYFGVHAGELTAAQSAQLAGIPKSPSAYAPHIDPEASVKRRNLVLGLMHANGCLSDEEYSEAKTEECVIKNTIPNERSLLTDRAIDEAVRLTGISRDALLTGGFRLVTTISREAQALCETIMADDAFFPTAEARAAMVLIDAEGGIIAMTGSRGAYDPTEPDRAAGMERQPGSLIKPILVYAPALEEGIVSGATVLSDEPKDFNGWSPRNSDEKYYGKVTLREAVARSLNVPAVEIMQNVGVGRAMAFASRLGISFAGEDAGLPLALGGFTHGVSPLEMAGAYSAVARGGLYTEPYCVLEVRDAEGGIVYSRESSYSRVMSAENAYILTSMLQSVASYGTGRRLSETGLPLAAKTGTAVDAGGVRDAWCAAYTQDVTAVVWMGTDSAKNGSLPEDEVGGNAPALMLAKLFTGLYAGTECRPFDEPAGVVTVGIDVSEIDEGKIALASPATPQEDIRFECFVRGSEPNAFSTRFSFPIEPDGLGWTTDSFGKPVISFIGKAPFLYSLVRGDLIGNETVVLPPQSVDGEFSFTDTQAVRGAAYEYRVIIENPNLGVEMEKASSRRLIVIAPF